MAPRYAGLLAGIGSVFFGLSALLNPIILSMIVTDLHVSIITQFYTVTYINFLERDLLGKPEIKFFELSK